MNEPFPCILLRWNNVLENIKQMVEFSGFSGLALRLFSPDQRQQKSHNFSGCNILLRLFQALWGTMICLCSWNMVVLIAAHPVWHLQGYTHWIPVRDPSGRCPGCYSQYYFHSAKPSTSGCCIGQRYLKKNLWFGLKGSTGNIGDCQKKSG